MKHTVRVYLLPVITQLEQRTGKRRKDVEYAKAIGISRQAFAALFDGTTGYVKDETLAKLLDFFYAEGSPATINDFYTVTSDRPGVVGGGAMLGDVGDDGS